MSEKERHASGLLYFIPHWIFEEENLSPSAKLVYALLSGLAHGNKDKVCFPSDEYIAHRLGFKRSKTANELVKELEDFGALTKRVDSHPNNPFRRIRYITIHLELKKSLRIPEKRYLDSSEKRTMEIAEKRTYSNKGYSNKEKKPPTEAKSARKSRAPHVSTSSEEHEKLVDEFGEDMIQKAYEKLSEWKQDTSKSKWKKNDHLAIRRWVIDALKEQDRKGQNRPKTASDRFNEVKEWCHSGEAQIRLQKAWKEELVKEHPDCIEFVGKGAAQPVFITYDEIAAKEKIENELRKRGI